jgi:hypothetical protein
MKTVGFCTHFTETDEWAFDYAFKLAQTHQLQLNICHWLESPYKIRRDIVYNDLFDHQEAVPVTPAVLNKLELRLREYYEPKLGDYTDVAFKLCEGAYQVELVRCFRQNLLDLVVMGYQELSDLSLDEQPLELFAMHLQYPVIIVGQNGPDTFLLNAKALEIHDQLDLPEESWLALEDANTSWQVFRPV